MTGQRASAVWKLEKTFGVEDTAETVWQRFGPSTNVTWTGNNNYSTYYGIGSKFWDAKSAGRFTGSFTINTMIDYANIAYLLLGFEDYSYDAVTGTHTFSKRNGKRVPSFTLHAKILNRMVGGPTDEDRRLFGCVVTSMDFGMEATSGAGTSVKISGFYVWEDNNPSALDETDYEDFTGDMVEWLCLQIPPGTGIADVDKIGFTVNNRGVAQPNTCSRKGSNYYEGNSEFGFSTSVYATDASRFYERFYSGGFRTGDNEPLAKNLKPIPAVRIASSYNDGTDDFSTTIDLTNVTVESMGRNLNPTQKLVDSPTFGAQKFSISIKNKVGSLQSLLD